MKILVKAGKILKVISTTTQSYSYSIERRELSLDTGNSLSIKTFYIFPFLLISSEYENSNIGSPKTPLLSTSGYDDNEYIPMTPADHYQNPTSFSYNGLEAVV